ncbi:MAG TPA: PIN domain-containing protein [Candidatus Eisenbacteria bacterium]|nr:PIN domain-containing protein [Candidatus Eisenbacteria bacterium]
MSRVFWDTNLFIYLIEGSGERARRVARLRQRMLERGDQLYTSALTLGEILVKPGEAGNTSLQQQYEQTISAGAMIIPFDQSAARAYAAIRKDRSIRPPDAIQLACAVNARVDLFITNDERLSQKVVTGIQFVTSLDKAFL